MRHGGHLPLVTSASVRAILRSIAEISGLISSSASAGDDEFTIENTRTGAAVQVRGDHPVSDFHFYAAPLAVCPEPFVRLELQPGQEARWKTDYTLLMGVPGQRPVPRVPGGHLKAAGAECGG